MIIFVTFPNLFFRCALEPTHCSPPSAMIPILEHSVSASSIECVVMMIAFRESMLLGLAALSFFERSLRFSMMAQISRRVSGLRPVEGSSNNQIRGLPTMEIPKQQVEEKVSESQMTAENQFTLNKRPNCIRANCQ